MLTFSALREANLSRAAEWHKDAPPWSLSDWGVALGGEVGELLNVIKKLNRVRDNIRGNEITAAELLTQLQDEIADVQIYLDLLAANAAVDLEHATIRKFNKTSLKNNFPHRL